MNQCIHLMCHNSGNHWPQRAEGYVRGPAHEAIHCRDREDDIVGFSVWASCLPWLGSKTDGLRILQGAESSLKRLALATAVLHVPEHSINGTAW